MSVMEIGQPSYYNQRFTLVAGVGALVAPANFFNNSRLLNIVRITPGGTVGTPTAVVALPVLASPLVNLLRLEFLLVNIPSYSSFSNTFQDVVWSSLHPH